MMSLLCMTDKYGCADAKDAFAQLIIMIPPGKDKMRYTSINHCKNANYQIDHYGTEHNAVSSFEKWAVLNDAIWAHLFEEKTGRQVATFNNVQGLSTLP